MFNDEEPAERVTKRIKLDLKSGSAVSQRGSIEEQFFSGQKTAQTPSKPVAVLSQEYTRTDLETVPVFVAELKDPKLASKCIRKLKELFPLKDLQHLKRIRRPPTDAGKKQVLQIILRDVYKDEFEMSRDNSISIKDIVNGDSLLEGLGNSFIIEVPKHPPLTREQFVKASELWPVNFHEDKYITKLLCGELFDNLALQNIHKYMDMARKSALVGKNNGMVAMGAVVVDPSSDNVVAVAYDLRCHGHPLQHAIMVVIDLVAQSQSGGTWNMGYQQESGVWTLPEIFDNLKINQSKSPLKYDEICKEDASKSQISEEASKQLKMQTELKSNNEKDTDKNVENKAMNDNKSGPYLCTGYDLYVTREPCIMCAMALVHSRIRRVFYGCKDPTVGALGSKYSLHTQDGLNHHFEVFCGVLEKECMELI